MSGTRRTAGRTAARVAAALLLAVLVLGGALGAAQAERVTFPAKGSQNGFVRACREAGAAPKREASRVVSCTKMDSDGDAQRITCNFKTNKCWRALEETGSPTRNDNAVPPGAGADPGDGADAGGGGNAGGGAAAPPGGGADPDGQ